MYTIHIVKEQHDVDLFWQLRDKYMLEDVLPNATFDPVSEEDKQWFFSQEYRDVIMEAFHRERAKLYIVFLRKDNVNIGFAVYVIYHSEEGKCLIVDFCIFSEHRNKGIGSSFFKMLRAHVAAQNALYFSLNLSNDDNKRFWEREGFKLAGKDEHGSDVYEKRPL